MGLGRQGLPPLEKQAKIAVLLIASIASCVKFSTEEHESQFRPTIATEKKVAVVALYALSVDRNNRRPSRADLFN